LRSGLLAVEKIRALFLDYKKKRQPNKQSKGLGNASLTAGRGRLVGAGEGTEMREKSNLFY
jgi:hypothetical protein